DLDHHAHAVDDGGIGHTLGGNAAGLLGGGGHALLAQPLHGLVHIAVGGGQRLLAIHHAHAGHLAQVLYISCGKSHFEFLQTVLVYTRKCRRRLLSVGSSLFRGGLSGLLTLLALQHGVGHDGGDQLDGADGVVVAGDHIIDLIGIAVGIGDGHHGNTQLVGLGDGVALLAGVHDEQGAGQLLHFLHAAQVLLQLGDLAQVLHDFLLGQHVEGAVLLHGLQLVQPVHTGAHGLEVGHHAAQPPGIHIELAATGGLLADGLLRLLLGAHEQQGLAALRQLTDEAVCLLQLADGLLQVHDID
ncbi:GPR endopeptidase, partial [Dysosmobacter welbionis]